MSEEDELIYSYEELQDLVIKYQNISNNLQQENKQLKERYERLKQEHIDTITRNEEKQQRIDKTIEYIKEMQDSCIVFSNIAYKELLEILGDKENE